MRKLLFFAGLLVSLSIFGIASAETRITSPESGDLLYTGKTYSLRWTGEDDDVSSYSVYLIGGRLGDAESKFLGTADADERRFEFTIPKSVRAGRGYMLQMSGRGASGDDSDAFTVKERKSNSRNVVLEASVGSVLYEGQDNLISWRGGRGVVQIGVKNADTDVILGWISVDENPNSDVVWDAREVCDLAMSECWEVRSLAPNARLRIVAVSEDTNGNLIVGGNSDESENWFRISSYQNKPGKPLATASEISALLKQIEELQKLLQRILAR
jgi:hypothetical protein